MPSDILIYTIAGIWILFCIQKQFKILLYIKYVLMLGSFIYAYMYNQWETVLLIWLPCYFKYAFIFLLIIVGTQFKDFCNFKK